MAAGIGIHAPKNLVNGSISPLRGDRLCHASMQPQTVSPVQHRKYNVGYQMSELKCGYEGMDTFSVQKNCDFSRYLIIDGRNENLCLHERPDLKQHLHD